MPKILNVPWLLLAILVKYIEPIILQGKPKTYDFNPYAYP